MQLSDLLNDGPIIPFSTHLLLKVHSNLLSVDIRINYLALLLPPAVETADFPKRT